MKRVYLVDDSELVRRRLVEMLSRIPYAQYRREGTDAGADYFLQKATAFERIKTSRDSSLSTTSLLEGGDSAHGVYPLAAEGAGVRFHHASPGCGEAIMVVSVCMLMLGLGRRSWSKGGLEPSPERITPYGRRRRR
jgi:hypothetical protein